jgi:hypothetical protein
MEEREVEYNMKHSKILSRSGGQTCMYGNGRARFCVVIEALLREGMGVERRRQRAREKEIKQGDVL